MCVSKTVLISISFVSKVAKSIGIALIGFPTITTLPAGQIESNITSYALVAPDASKIILAPQSSVCFFIISIGFSFTKSIGIKFS